MKRSFFITFAAFYFCSFVSAAFAQEFRTVHPGIEYAVATKMLGKQPVKVNLLRLDPEKVRIDVHHALDSAVGTETLSSIARRRKAVAGINAGFFRFDTSIFAGNAAGILKIDGKLLSESGKGRVAVAITNTDARTDVEFGHPETRAYVTIAGERFSADGINRERKPGEVIIYTSEFFRTTLTGPAGTEVVADDCSKRDAEFRCERVRVNKDSGSTVIPHNGFVFSIGPDAEAATRIAEALHKKPDKIRFSLAAGIAGAPNAFANAEDITNGVPQLIKNGKIDITWEREGASRSFAQTRHPRTAMAKLKNGKLLMLVADGRQPGVSVGMTLKELAEYLLELAAMDAINLDGGGSTTMVLDGKVVNTPSANGKERKIGDALLVTLRP